MSNGKIDIVVTWVDGNDPEWLRQKAEYSPRKDNNASTANRFRDWDLMKYWFRGVEKYAPWVNRIFFVTCGHYPEWLNQSNPKLKIIKHSDYIPKELLPTFNSNVIEMYIHNIEELSERFVLFNDDCFIISPTNENDFFEDGLPRDAALLGLISANATEDVFPHILLNNCAVINKHFSKKEVMRAQRKLFFSPQYGMDMVRNLLLLSFKYFSDFRDMHLPISHLKSCFKEVWDAEPEYMYNATKSRFRSCYDVNHWLIKDWYMCKGQFRPRSPKWGMKFELGVDTGYEDYILGHRGKIVCLNDSSDKIDFDGVRGKLFEVFEEILPDKSSFEC